MKKPKILLLSSSKYRGGDYLNLHAEIVKSFLKGIKRIVFVPYSAHSSNWDSYTQKVSDCFKPWGIEVVGIHTILNNIEGEKAIFIGGGNTFRLLYNMQVMNMIKPIREAVLGNEMLYIGASAGSNLACPTIKTTNDKPILYPPNGLGALGLVYFQINPHYLDPTPDSKYMGETHEERIREFHEETELGENRYPVIGLREGAYLQIDENYDYYKTEKVFLGGLNGAKVFYPNRIPANYGTPCVLEITDSKVRSL